MVDFWTILGNVAGAVFGPWLVSILSVCAIVIGFGLAMFSGSEEANAPGWVILVAWVSWVLLTVGAVSLCIYIGQFEPFDWRYQGSA